jgi:hypothetical protein
MRIYIMAKTPQYTPAEEKQLLELWGDDWETRPYEESHNLAGEIGDLMGKGQRSIVAKLSRMNVYVTKEPVTKSGEKVMTKADIAGQIGDICGMKTADADSMVTSSKQALRLVLSFVTAKAETEAHEEFENVQE